MLTIEMLDEEIKKLEECENPTWRTCEKLATLYIIKDNFSRKISNSSLRVSQATTEKL